ncbi:MAG: ATP synthase F0 subunit B [Desulfarculaceae bacterium]
MSRLFFIMVLLALAALAGPDSVLAAEAQEAAGWRVWWDLGWRIVNFLILAVLIYKVAKQPLLEFLRGQRDVVSMDLNKLKKAKAAAITESQAIEEKTKNLAEELAQYEDRLAAVAAKQRDAIIEAAKRESEIILERAQLWAQQKMRKARVQLAEEILELAAEIAAEKVSQNITAQDKTRMLNEFTGQITQQRPS